MANTTNLIESIKNKKWCDVNLHLNQAKIADVNNTFPLHEVCKVASAPIHIVNDIYRSYPQAALEKSKNQYTPIYIAVEYEFEEAVAFLCDVCPESTMIGDKVGDTPLQLTIYGMHTNNMIDSIINAKPEAALVIDKHGDSAFDNFFRQWNVVTRIAVKNKTCDEILHKYTGIGSWKYQDIYDKACLFLKAANFCKNIRNYESHLLHAALREESCYWAFCKLLMKIHPNQILERDTDGNLPIHIITASNEGTDEETFLCTDCFMTKDMLIHIKLKDGNDRYCCEECLPCISRESIGKAFCMRPVRKLFQIVSELVAIVPQMVFIPDRNGDYPLHIAIQNQQSHDVIYELFKAFPEMGTIIDERTSLVPFMLAAVGKWKNEELQMTITYQLLRESPHSIM